MEYKSCSSAFQKVASAVNGYSLWAAAGKVQFARSGVKRKTIAAGKKFFSVVEDASNLNFTLKK